ncbi:hypothetical protein [Streptomyces pseudovenezuelae]|uniref:hypothetical protein n=1 Tax=Streptomyces pseudovenezuelae TaxID=67350 RepID=UPI002E33249F|nr:hypothetical protein [Streptomyces pseudovenezuelae]
MSDQPYTDGDLRYEAARQLRSAGEDPDFMGIGEQMDRAPIDSTFYDANGERHEQGRVWDQLDTADFNAAQSSIADLINGAADVSDWAVDLGADGLEPDEHKITLKVDERPIVRVHFAFAPELSETSRDLFATALGEVAARELRLTQLD